MRDILKKIQVNLPFQQLLHQYLPIVVKEKINPEIGFNCHVLDGTPRGEFLRVADILRETGVRITFHAPFMDLRPGALDPRIRQVTIDRLNQVFDLVPAFQPSSVVCHPSFDERYYVTTGARWLENSVLTWGMFSEKAKDMNTVIMLENVYESDPGCLGALLDQVNSPCLRFCFDTGHFNAYSKTDLTLWLERLGRYVGELHLHDNEGSTDDHLPVGKGNFPFDRLFAFLREKGISPIVTVEPHTEQNLWDTLAYIRETNLLDHPGGNL
jgi:sugar phosphate isomerase/epimerase